MPLYRLLDGHATVLAVFEAEGDDHARGQARELSQRRRYEARPRYGARVDYWLERQTPNNWKILFTWVPD